MVLVTYLSQYYTVYTFSMKCGAQYLRHIVLENNIVLLLMMHENQSGIILVRSVGYGITEI